MDHHDHAVDVAAGQLGSYGVEGIADPGAHFRVAVLMDGKVVGFGGEEGCLGVYGSVVQDVVDADG